MNIDFNMTADYCKDWSAIDALREIVQNALDSNNPYECRITHDKVTVTSRHMTLAPKDFSLGASTKHKGCIGKYGEGFKIAMLVLTREGLRPHIHSGFAKVQGAFYENDFTKQHTFNLIITEDHEDFADGVYFTCDSTNIDIGLLKERVTPFSEHPLPKVRNKAEILYTRPGKLYVNGLFVCEDSSLSLGYNFSPGSIELNRDRNMVDGLFPTLGKYYANLPDTHAETIFNLVENEASDVGYLQCYIPCNNELKAELARLFYNKYSDGATIAKPGGYYCGSSGGVSMGHAARSVYRQCGVKDTVEAISPESPLGIINSFVTTNKKRMRRDLRTAFDVLANQAKAWKK